MIGREVSGAGMRSIAWTPEGVQITPNEAISNLINGIQADCFERLFIEFVQCEPSLRSFTRFSFRPVEVIILVNLIQIIQ